ncbi:putative signal transducing protein [Fodinibius halophilus]|uniref:DUF2007 domain-containing protein n=1 Tax=Fodinibius halophilus TaxID=1736908 RepID=A0A6M1TB46_9BACT|nr:DUF2007 domain-containing protein [Fodinibius halophilus]NGP89633.1 DUF2007 domain-containing protein [Fodinibius halophilus]
MFNEADPNEIENWACVMEAGTEYKVEMAKDHLADQDIPANILSKRDSALSLNIGDTALVYLYVPNEYEEEAREILAETALNNEGEEE